MTQKIRTTFKTDKNIQFPDNAVGTITALRLREQMDHLADSAAFPEDFVGNSLLMTSAERTKLAGIDTYTHPNHTGDITSIGDGSTTIAPGVVSNTKMVPVATGTIKGRLSAGSGAPEDLTLTQVTTNLSLFTTTTRGLVPPSVSTANNVLKDDGTFVNHWGLPVTTNIIPSSDSTRSLGNTSNKFVSLNVYDINLNGVLFSSTNLSNPGANKFLGWNNTDGDIKYFGIGNGLSIANNAIVADLAYEIQLNIITTNYTLALVDRQKKILSNSTINNTITIPLNATIAFPLGALVAISSINTGVTTIQVAAGVTLNGVSGGSCSISNTYSGISLLKIGTDAWLIEGNHGIIA